MWAAFAKRQDTTLDQDRIQGKFQSPGYGIQGALARVGSKAQSGGPHTRPKGSEVALQRGKIAKMPKCVQNLPIFFRNISLMPHGVLRCPTQMSIQCCFRMPLHPWKTQCSLEADPGWIQGQPLWVRLSDPRQAALDPGQCHIAIHGSKATPKSSSRSAQSDWHGG